MAWAGMMKTSVTRLVGAIAVIAALDAGSARAEYLLQTGDVVEVAIAGLPDLKQQSMVDLDGRVTVPLVGLIDARNKTVETLAEEIRTEMSERVYTNYGSPTQDVIAISSDQISISVAEYRPIYVKGDVTTPGEHAFRPGLTVRQAIAKAGGIGIPTPAVRDVGREIGELQTRYSTLWADLLKSEIRKRQLDAQLDGTEEFDVSGLASGPVDPSTLETIGRVAMQQIDALQGSLENERNHLSEAIGQTAERLELLQRQQVTQEESFEFEKADLERLRKLQERGAVPIARVSEIRRQMALSSTGILDTMNEAAALETKKGDLERELTKIDETTRIELLEQLRDVTLDAARIRAEMQGVGRRMALAGAPGAAAAMRTGDPTIVIVRLTENGQQTIDASEDTPLEPGDVIELTASFEAAPVIEPAEPADPLPAPALPSSGSSIGTGRPSQSLALGDAG